MTPNDLTPGQSAIITKITTRGPLGRRFLELGLRPGAEIRLEGRAPLGDPLKLRLHGQILALRTREAAAILLNRS